jgi:hypothetical protein
VGGIAIVKSSPLTGEDLGEGDLFFVIARHDSAEAISKVLLGIETAIPEA